MPLHYFLSTHPDRYIERQRHCREIQPLGTPPEAAEFFVWAEVELAGTVVLHLSGSKQPSAWYRERVIIELTSDLEEAWHERFGNRVTNSGVTVVDGPSVFVTPTALGWEQDASGGVAIDAFNVETDYPLLIWMDVAVRGVGTVLLRAAYRVRLVVRLQRALPPPFATPTGAMLADRVRHTASTLGDGQVLVVGGSDGRAFVPLRSAERFDPNENAWAPTEPMHWARSYHAAVEIPPRALTGNQPGVLVIGGIGDAPESQISTEVYWSGAAGWTELGHLRRERWHHTATLLADDSILVTGGNLFAPSERIDLRDPQGEWFLQGHMVVPRTWHVAARLADGSVVVVGGIGGDESASSAELFEPSTGAWRRTGSLNVPRHHGHTATALSDGTVMVTGGFGATGAVDAVELYDPTSGTWTVGPPLRQPHALHTATLLPGDRVLVVGNYEAEVYEPEFRSWRLLGQTLDGHWSHTATLLPDARLLVAGGTYGSTRAELLYLGGA